MATWKVGVPAIYGPVRRPEVMVGDSLVVSLVVIPVGTVLVHIAVTVLPSLKGQGRKGAKTVLEYVAIFLIVAAMACAWLVVRGPNLGPAPLFTSLGTSV